MRAFCEMVLFEGPGSCNFRTTVLLKLILKRWIFTLRLYLTLSSPCLVAKADAASMFTTVTNGYLVTQLN